MVFLPISSIGKSQWLFDDSLKIASSAGEYQSAGAAVFGSSAGAHLACPSRGYWNVRTPAVSIGYLDKDGHAELPLEEAEPERVVRSPTIPLLSRSKPSGTPVFDGAMKL